MLGGGAAETKVPPKGINVRRDTPVPGLSMGANLVGACWVVTVKMGASTVGACCKLVREWAGVASGSGFSERDTLGSDMEASDIGRPKSVRMALVSALGRGLRLQDVGGSSNGDWAMSGSK